MKGTILVVEDDARVALFLRRLLVHNDYQVETAGTAAAARQLAKELSPDVVLLDLNLPDAHGHDLMPELLELVPTSQFIVVTGDASIRSAVKATRRGAADYLSKPIEPEELLLAIRNVRKQQVLDDQLRRSQAQSGQPSELAFPSAAMRRVMSLATRAAKGDGIVLLTGESGTGKDYLSRWIHRNSSRSRSPYFSINCAALPRELAESELFGHEPGAFTGSTTRKRGLLECAEGGTLLLNEIGELELALQSKLLTFLDTRQIVRLGGERPVTVDARLLTATNRDLEKEVEVGNFRRDLYYRINVFPLHMPPLRERADDMPLLVADFLNMLAQEMGLSQRPRITEEALQQLASYQWPGNLRELRNVLERALIVADGQVVARHHLSLKDKSSGSWKVIVPFPDGSRSLHEVTKDVARQLLEEALSRSHTKQEAARLLGISRHALAHQLRSLGIDPDEQP